MIRIRHTDESPHEASEINVTPFIDVMLVLLVIFMVTAPLTTVNVPVDLPSSTEKPIPRPDDPVFLTVKVDHSLALGEDDITTDALPVHWKQQPKAIRTSAFFCVQIKPSITVR